MTNEEYIETINMNTNLDQDSVNIKAQKDLSFHEGYKLGRTDATNAFNKLRDEYSKLESITRGLRDDVACRERLNNEIRMSKREHEIWLRRIDSLKEDIERLEKRDDPAVKENKQLKKENEKLKKEGKQLAEKVLELECEDHKRKLPSFLCGIVVCVVIWTFAKRWGH